MKKKAYGQTYDKHQNGIKVFHIKNLNKIYGQATINTCVIHRTDNLFQKELIAK